MNKEEIISFLQLTRSGHKGWHISGKSCPYCGKSNHLAVIISFPTSSFICQKCKEHGTLWTLLSKFDRLDLISNKFKTLEKKIVEDIISSPNKEDIIKIDYSLPIISPPIGFKRISYHNYLTEERGFQDYQYNMYNVGYTERDPTIGKEYVVFLIKDIEKNIVGYLARSIYSKEKIKKINEKRKERALKQGKIKYKKYLRWKNSNNDFGKMLLGCHEIIRGVTKTIIIVEGITDKANVDNLLSLEKDKKMKCNATFSNKISPAQIKILQDLGVENIILLYDSDPDLLNINKEMAFELNSYFNVEVGFQKDYKDPGEYDMEDIVEVLNTLESPRSFSQNKVQIEDI